MFYRLVHTVKIKVVQSGLSASIFGLAVWTCSGATLNRTSDPIVLQGSQLPALQGAAPNRVVGFRYDAGWTQAPVQVDERKWVDFTVVYGLAPTGLVTMAYADANTFAGADTNTSFDIDDELVFMTSDVGRRAPPYASLPLGVQPTSGVEIAISDPLDGGMGYLYLFRHDGSLSPDAGKDYVHYDFHLLCGTYTNCYGFLSGPNPENSTVTTDVYRTHFSDRWIRDELNILTGGATGVDILDRHKNSLGPPPGGCGRTEDTFSAGEGAFFANIDGPVRAIRSYMGANSGPFTQRDHLCYRERQDIHIMLRVHGGIPGPMDLYDYSEAATNMVYYNNLNTNGIVVDGMPDIVTNGSLAWEMITGTQGTLIASLTFETDIVPFTDTSYTIDDSTPPVPPCTGDSLEYGTSGPWVNIAPMPNTDPILGPANTLTGIRTIYYEGPNQPVTLAELRDQQARTPLTTTFLPYAGDSDNDGMADDWEIAVFGTLATSAGSDDDIGGGDGATALKEYVAGTDPTDPASFPELRIMYTNDAVYVTFVAVRAEGVGYTGLQRFYDVQDIANFTDLFWVDIPGFTNVLGNHQLVTFTNDMPDLHAEHGYRTRIRLQQEGP